MISVITPVYNSEKFLNKAIESVLMQPEVSEHLIIDDGSTDNSWSVITKYAEKDKRIIALKHDDGKNHGRSKTRNLGIQHAKNKLIAFLDADDFYLENRFKNDIKILTKDPTVDGVYNAIGIHFYDSYKGNRNIKQVLTTLSREIEPENLFENMVPFGNSGCFSGDGFLVKREILNSVGGFNENLEVAEDTELWSKLSLKYKLQYGDLENQVSKRGVHDSNIFNNKNKYVKPRLLMFLSLLEFAAKNKASKERLDLVISSYLKYLTKYSKRNFIVYLNYWCKALMISSYTLKNKLFYKAFVDYSVSILNFIFRKVKQKMNL
jgi:glycosyltransferase involved in cell wall biosynthesis